MEGWIKLYRKILTSDMYAALNCKQKVVLFTLLLMANHQAKRWEYQGEIYEVKPGQMITSIEKIRSLSGASDLSVQNVRTALLKLERWGFLTNISTHKNRLITIVNWDVYQHGGEEINKESNWQSTNSQQTNHKLFTDCLQRSDKQLTTNKNVKNDKNVEKEKNVKNEEKEKKEREKILSFPWDEKKKNDKWKQIKQRFVTRRGRGIMLSAKDIEAMERMMTNEIPLDDILAGIDYAFDHYQPRYTGDQLQSLVYCEQVIAELWEQKKESGGKGGEAIAKDQSSRLEHTETDGSCKNYI